MQGNRKALEREIAQITGQGRLPPGQVLTEKWPVLHEGTVPVFDPATWDLRLFGRVEAPVRLTYPEFMALPKGRLTSDIHCVTRWSKFDCEWEGVSAAEVVRRVSLGQGVTHVLVHGEQGYSANLPVGDLLDETVLFAYRMNGEDLTPEHGWPLRLLVPKLYLWKSVKWVRGVEFLDRDRPGFWERYGYHIYGDPWREQRYSDD